MKRKVNDCVDRWQLHDLLGAGGNAEVWEASREDRTVALKILRNYQNAEPYKRFRQEISSLLQLSDDPGVLPLLDYSLPERPSFQNPGWLATPVASRLDKFLQSNPPLTEIVSSVHQISETLARCAEKGIYHRDIKPANLYKFKGRSVIGDFGLVYLPDRESLTKAGKKLGPTFFIPDEMLNDAENAKPAPADVFMLAKTLWVLATGQNYPPQGEIRSANRQTRLSGYWNEPKAYFLDRLIERCTDVNPNNRPTMCDVAEELSAWLSYGAKTLSSAIDLLDIGAKLNPLVIAHRNNLSLNLKMKEECERLRNEIEVLLQSLADQINQQTNLEAKVTKDNIINSAVKHPEKYNKGGSFGPSSNIEVKVAAGCRTCGVLVSGIGLMVTEDIPTISLYSAHAIRDSGEKLLWSKHAEIIPNSAREKEVITELIDELYKSMRFALNEYAEHLARTEPDI